MKINHNAPVPPGGAWRWVSPVTGRTLTTRSAARKLIQEVRGYQSENGHEVQTPEQIEHDICMQMGLIKPYCKGSESVPSGRTTLETLASASKAFVAWVSGGMALAPMEQVEARAEICARCPRNQPLGGCMDCIPEVAAQIAQDALVSSERRSKLHSRLHNCQQCGCRLTLKTQLPDAATQVGPKQQFPEWCWVPKAAGQGAVSAESPPSS